MHKSDGHASVFWPFCAFQGFLTQKRVVSSSLLPCPTVKRVMCRDEAYPLYYLGFGAGMSRMCTPSTPTNSETGDGRVWLSPLYMSHVGIFWHVRTSPATPTNSETGGERRAMTIGDLPGFGRISEIKDQRQNCSPPVKRKRGSLGTASL